MSPAGAIRAAKAAAALAFLGLMAVLALAGDDEPVSACRSYVYREPVSGRQAATGRMDVEAMRRCLAIPHVP